MNHGVGADADNSQEPIVVEQKIKSSDALSMIKNPTLSNTIATRQIAFLCGEGVNDNSVDSMKKALEKEGALVKIIAPHLGTIKTQDGKELKVDESYLINQTDSSYYVFILEDADWPMQNRYQVSKLNVKHAYPKSLVRFRSVPNFIEKRTDAIQIKQHEGYWELEDRSEHQCVLEYVLIQNPGGHVPPWLANFQAVENPYQSIFNLKELAENTRIRP